jgi:DNA mismatch endonuclease Vsr
MTPPMPDVPEVRRRMMAAVRSKDTAPEMTVRRLVHGLGYRFRLHRRDLPGRPDLVFPARKAAVEVRGCFWHQHAGCPRAALPRTRREWWEAKLASNVARDKRNAAALTAMGWRLLTVWECEVGDAEALETRLRDFLGPRGDLRCEIGGDPVPS